MKDLHNFLYKKNRQQQVKGFYYVARMKSISQAAEQMNLTQSTVTQQIQSLERDLGRKLIKRDTKPLTLTQDGEDFYEMACPLVQKFESIIERFLEKKSAKESKKIDIAVHHIAISYLMPKIVNHFKKNNPDAEIFIRNISPSDAMKRLKEGKIDLAFYPNLSGDLKIEKVSMPSYDPVLIVKKSHPLAKKQIKSLKDLKEFELIRIDSHLIALPLFEEALKAYKIGGKIKFENGSWEILKSFVRENNVAAVVSTLCISECDKNIFVIKNLSAFFPKMNYVIATRMAEIPRQIVKSFIDSCESSLL